LVDELEQRRFGVILLTTDLSSERATHDAQGPCITEPFHRAILQNYRLARTFEFHLWEQKHYYAWVRRAR
jgi:hypothetical protein